MKENCLEFETSLPVQEIASIFQLAVKKRPLKLKVAKFEFFTPTAVENPFAAVDGTIAPDFEVGAGFTFPTADPPTGAVVLSCLSADGGTRVLVSSRGNMRGRALSNSLMKHIVVKISERDPRIQPESYSGRI